MGESDVLNTVNVFNKGVTHARDILNLKQHTKHVNSLYLATSQVFLILVPCNSL